MKHIKHLAFLLVLCAGLAATPIRAHDSPESFSPVLQKTLPAIVKIGIFAIRTQGATQPRMSDMLPSDSPLRKFFPKTEERIEGKKRELVVFGSGFIIDSRGYIVTNYHVIEKASEVEITVNGRKPTIAKIIGFDKESDLAVLKIELGKEMPFVSFGNSDLVEVGDRSIVVGNPFGVGTSATTGIISARDRSNNDSPNIYFQTDAPMNPGNSGGPLLNLAGEVIGVNTWITSTSGGSVGIGFATESNIVKHVVKEILAYGYVRRGWIGIELEIKPNVSPLTERTQDVFVTSVTAGSPADEAGLKVGDLFISVNRKKLKTYHDLMSAISFAPVGDPINIEIQRGESKLALTMSVRERAQQN